MSSKNVSFNSLPPINENKEKSFRVAPKRKSSFHPYSKDSLSSQPQKNDSFYEIVKKHREKRGLSPVPQYEDMKKDERK